MEAIDSAANLRNFEEVMDGNIFPNGYKLIILYKFIENGEDAFAEYEEYDARLVRAFEKLDEEQRKQVLEKYTNF